MNPIVHAFVSCKSRQNTAEKDYSGRKAPNRPDRGPDYCQRYPGARRKDTPRIPMMTIVKGRRERLEGMAQPAVDHVIDEGPCQKATDECPQNSHGLEFNLLTHVCHLFLTIYSYFRGSSLTFPSS